MSPNDTALVTAPTYLGALQAFSAYEPRYDTLRPEHGNRTPQSYREAASAAGGEVKFAYVVPDFANPTGETLTLEARRGLLALADELDIPVLEDAAYRALRFEGAATPSIQALDVARAVRSTPRASSISAPSPRRLRRACGSAGSAPRAP